MILSRVAVADGGVALSPALSLTEAKRHLNVYHDLDDALIEAYVAAAQAHLEGDDGCGGTLGRAITRHTLDYVIEAFPRSRELLLPQPPLVSVTSVTYLDTVGTSQTLSSSLYHVMADRMAPRIRLRDTAEWPDTDIAPDAVRIRYVIGPDAVPADVRAALMLHLGNLYANRGDDGSAATVLPPAHRALLDKHRTHGWI